LIKTIKVICITKIIIFNDECLITHLSKDQTFNQKLMVIHSSFIINAIAIEIKIAIEIAIEFAIFTSQFYRLF